MTLAERHRPKTLADILGQPKAVGIVARIIGRDDFDGDAFWIVGPSGSGKASLALIIAARFASPAYTYELDGQACTVDAVREAAQQIASARLTADTRRGLSTKRKP